ncbi:solute carrier family 13 (sodium-dependent dicarboxylate transporter), member 2/3/5 [Mariprofundus ferrinatatus]|uniref:Solute carrier family 13 (Sodium-dependent dicarboxylate transporter), member 2/3/5 n=1 Tax=Mariprofundus ferrinatatus TaxID=1921087 RepID=A0A2K8L2V7_9PROT|nr:SLC13 family permease [Mariprofundus ferrinatatus]ATX81627.1 solute carrier family 13 (sodium-dependent dicarboxylate transporter), member 2/3/5 [Mariprofundus ferrinatatus]
MSINTKIIALFTGPAVATACLLLVDITDHPAAAAMLAVALWMAIWWISECVPLGLTALIPLIAFPLLGIATGKEIAPRYINSIIFLFIGGFLIAQAMENCGLHKRIALNMLSRLHASPLQLAMGFAGATAFLSMWISNTATAMLMVTIALPLLKRLMEEHDAEEVGPMAATFLLIIAYSANIGGMGTPVGSPPNLVFLENMRISLPNAVPSFLEWMMVGIPMMIAGLVVLFIVLGPQLAKLPWKGSDGSQLKKALTALGPSRREEKLVAWVLTTTALLWMTRSGIQSEGLDIPGWASLLPYKGVDDGTVAIFMASLLFLFRSEDNQPILGREAFSKLPWDIVLLFGGGFALAFGMQQSGLSFWIGEQLEFLKSVPLPLMMLAVAVVIIFLTEITSNTATTQVMLPILAAASLANGLDAMSVMLVATIGASCAFMLPVATPPNAIIFGSGLVPMHAMVRAGIRLNLIMIVVVTTVVYFLRPLLPAI